MFAYTGLSLSFIMTKHDSTWRPRYRVTRILPSYRKTISLVVSRFEKITSRRVVLATFDSLYET